MAPAPYLPATTAAGGLRLPPFMPKRNSLLTGTEMPVSYMTLEQANQLKDRIFAQLDQFDEYSVSAFAKPSLTLY